MQWAHVCFRFIGNKNRSLLSNAIFLRLSMCISILWIHMPCTPHRLKSLSFIFLVHRSHIWIRLAWYVECVQTYRVHTKLRARFLTFQWILFHDDFSHRYDFFLSFLFRYMLHRHCSEQKHQLKILLTVTGYAHTFRQKKSLAIERCLYFDANRLHDKAKKQKMYILYINTIYPFRFFCRPMQCDIFVLGTTYT